METTHNKTLKSATRSSIRNEVIKWFLHEDPGTGKGEFVSRNFYNVEKYNEFSIILKRPANLNKGFDFVVYIDGVYFKNSSRRHSNPKHSDILDSLEQVYKKNGNLYNKKIKPILNDIFNCLHVEFRAPTIATFIDCDEVEKPIEIILLAIKWLFIEQDITYWNWSGRNMLYSKLKKHNLV